MIHYNFLKLTQAADAEAVLARCREVYAELEAELDFLHDAKVSRCITVRDSNADIMMVMRLDRRSSFRPISSIRSMSRWRRA